MPMTKTIPPQYARLGGLVKSDGVMHLIKEIGKPTRFDANGWPIEVSVEVELCDPQPVTCDFVNGDGLPCLNEAEDGDGRCSWHPIISGDARRAELYQTGVGRTFHFR